MKRKKLVISNVAVADLQEIWEYIARDSITNADKMVDSLYSKCELLGVQPEIGRKREELGSGLRSFPVGRYVIFYRIKDDTLEIVRILSGYRDIENIM